MVGNITQMIVVLKANESHFRCAWSLQSEPLQHGKLCSLNINREVVDDTDIVLPEYRE